jgi:G:T/U-mismatch repair DNA glycosylase
LRRGDFEGAAERLNQMAHELRPRWFAFVGKEAYRGAFGERSELGRQERRLSETDLFVLPSTSPANAAVPWEERLRWFRELAALSEPSSS